MAQGWIISGEDRSRLLYLRLLCPRGLVNPREPDFVFQVLHEVQAQMLHKVDDGVENQPSPGRLSRALIEAAPNMQSFGPDEQTLNTCRLQQSRPCPPAVLYYLA